MSRDNAALLDILRAGKRAVEFLGKCEKAIFLADAKTQSACLHQLLVLGEAVKRLSDDFKNAHPDIPWKQMAGMRDKLIHDYDDVDQEAVWHTLRGDVPRLIEAIGPFAPSSTPT